jgi:hypothetical protein
MGCYFSRLQMSFNNVDTERFARPFYRWPSRVWWETIQKHFYFTKKKQSKSAKKEISFIDRFLQQHQLGVRTYGQLPKSVIIICMCTTLESSICLKWAEMYRHCKEEILTYI